MFFYFFKLKQFFAIAGIIFLFVAFTGIFSEPEPIISSDKPFFSPNNDGKNDTITFHIKWTDPRKLSNWFFKITDENGKLIREYSSDLRHKRKKSSFKYWFSKPILEPVTILLPKEIEWLGTDSKGIRSNDGRYIAQLIIITATDFEIRSPELTFYLDSTSPYGKAHAEIKYFTPNDDKIFDSVNIKQDVFGESGDRWKGMILNEKEEPIRNFYWDTKSVPKLISWDGKDDRGILQQTGIYSYKLIGEDFF